MSVQVPNGTVDIAVEDEAEAVAVAKKYLSYFQGALPEWRAADQRLLRRAIPENRLRVYDVRDVIDTLCDEGSVLELRRAFGARHGDGAGAHRGQAVRHRRQQSRRISPAPIDSDGSDKAARFLQLCDAFDLPVLFLCDTPGMMVGPGGREDGAGAPLLAPVRDRRQSRRAVRHHRAAQGLWAGRPGDGRRLVPCRHLRHLLADRRVRRHGARGRGQARLPQGARGGRDPAERRALFDKMVAAAYARGKALSTATYFEVDEVIDPADSRRWIATALLDAKPRPRNAHKKRPNIDTW